MNASTATANQQPMDIFQALMELLGIMLFRFPVPLRLWIGVLVAANMGGLALSDGPEVKIIAAIFNVGAFIMASVYQKHGFVRLLGVGHSIWPFMLPWIAFKVMPKYADDELMTRWFSGIILFNGISLVLDVMDVYRYFNGENKPTAFWNKETKKEA
jgi:hypothetical protein